MKKIVFSDIDKTLAKGSNISIKNINEIKRIKNLGVEFVLASGRSLTYTKKIAKIIDSDNYIISNNGALAYDNINNKVIYASFITKENLLKINNLCNEEVNITYQLLDKDINVLEESDYDKVVQVVIITKNRELLLDIMDKINNIEGIKVANKHKSFYDSTYPLPFEFYIDVANSETDKSIAIKHILNYLNLESTNSIRFGDGINDIKMFESDSFNVAVDNAIPEVKERANMITTSYDNDGVGNALEKIFDNK